MLFVPFLGALLGFTLCFTCLYFSELLAMKRILRFTCLYLVLFFFSPFICCFTCLHLVLYLPLLLGNLLAVKRIHFDNIVDVLVCLFLLGASLALLAFA
jgi:hypothetical protein